jgi:protein-tyrosine phosphatase
LEGLSQILGGSAWIAISRPFLTGYGYPARANSPNFWDTPHVLEGLAVRGIEVNGRARMPIQIQESDLAEADLIIAMKEGEHRAYLEANFPSWTDKIEYWHVHDIDVAPVNETLSRIEHNLHALIQRLSGVYTPSPTQ